MQVHACGETRVALDADGYAAGDGGPGIDALGHALIGQVDVPRDSLAAWRMTTMLAWRSIQAGTAAVARVLGKDDGPALGGGDGACLPGTGSGPQVEIDLLVVVGPIAPDDGALVARQPGYLVAGDLGLGSGRGGDAVR